METPREYVITSDPRADPRDVEVVHAGLRAYNDLHASPVGRRSVQIFLRDARGVVRGGLLGHHLWGWLEVHTLWVEESWRGRGLGSRLLARAEDEARAAGCTRVFLDTLEFQALPFYEGRGYSVFAVLDDFPPGLRRFFLRKALGTDP